MWYNCGVNEYVCSFNFSFHCWIEVSQLTLYCSYRALFDEN